MKKITHLLILFLFFTTEMFCQVPIGNGENRDQGLPFDPSYQYSYTQSIYKAAEINSSGAITSLQWYFAGSSMLTRSQDLVVYLGHTTKNVFSGPSDWQSISNLTEVYTGGISVSGAGWVTITFDTPFTYNGTSNLIVAVQERMSGSDSYTEDFYNTAVAGNRSIYSNSSGISVSAPPSGMLAAYIPNVVFGGITQSCANPINEAIVELLNDSATFSWSPNGTENAWEVLVIPAASAEPTAATEGMPVTGTPEYSAIDLTPSTSYKFYVRADCDTEFSGWIGPIEFTTQCAPVSEINEGFDVSTASLPACWLRLGSTGSLYVQNQQSAVSSPNVLYISNGSENLGPVLVLPLVNNAADATHRLRFSARGSFSSTGVIEVGYVTSILDASSFVSLQSFNITSSTQYETFVAELGTSPESNNLAIRQSGQPYTPVYVDNIVWEPITTCGEITDLAITSVFNSTAGISWDDNAYTSWQYAVGTATDANPFNLTHKDATAAQVTINDLAPSTFYKVWVRVNCGNGDFGPWAGPISFTTQCAPVTQINEGFDASTSLPACWKRVGGNGSVTVQSLTGAPTSPNALYLANTTPVNGSQLSVASLPYVSNLAAGTHRLRFKARGASATGGIIEVGYLTNIVDASSFVVLESFTINSTTSFESHTLAPQAGSFAGNLAFRHTGVPSNPVYIDDVIWEALPLCSDITDLAYSNLGSNSVSLSWGTTGIEADWQYVIGAPTVTNPSTLTAVDVSDIPEVVINTLQPTTSYKIWVRSDCGNGNFGGWFGPISITTQCSEVATYMENFDSGTNLPACFGQVGSGSVFIQNPGSGSFSAPNILYIYDAVLALPPVSNAAAGTHRLKFKAKGAYSPGDNTITVGYLTNENGAVNFVPLQSFTATSSTEFQTFSAEPGTQPLSNTIAIKHTGMNAVALDDITWELLPTCADVYGIAYENLLANSTTINWQTNGTESSWEYAIGDAAATNPDALESFTTDTTSADFISLAASTTYKVWVRSDCGSGSYGSWTGPFTFTTQCSEVTAFTQNFDAATTLPACFKKVGSGGSLFIQGFDTTAPSSPNNVFMYSSILSLPPVSNAAAGTHSLKFKARAAYSEGENTITVGYITDVNDASTFVGIETFTASFVTEYETFIADLGTQPLSNTLAIKHSGVNSVVIDDIVWEQTLSTGGFDTNALSVYPNPVKNILTILYSHDIESVTVFNMLGQKVAEQKINANEAKMDMSEFTSGTYIVKVSAGNQVKTMKIIKD